MGFPAAFTEEERNNIAVYEKVADGVVNITNTAVQMDFFFNAFPTQGSGSGSIIDTRGHILTNHHVVANAQKLEVTLADESKWPAKLVGSDPDNDLAVIKMDAPKEKLKVIPMGDSRAIKDRPEGSCHWEPLWFAEDAYHRNHQFPWPDDPL